LVNTRFAGKKRLAQHELCHHAASRPDIFHLLLKNHQGRTNRHIPILVV
jgi:hypothetical protein